MDASIAEGDVEGEGAVLTRIPQLLYWDESGFDRGCENASTAPTSILILSCQVRMCLEVNDHVLADLAFLIVAGKSTPWSAVGMRTFHGRLSAIGAGALLLLLCNQTHALARASQAGHDDPWSSERIDRLPTEVRNAVIRMCGHSLHVAHYFATYVDNSRFIKLHFELLHCDEQAIFCKGDGCLQQTYVAIGGHYRLMKSYYARSNN